MPVPFGKPVQERTVERDPRGRVDRIEAIHLVDRLSPHDGPPARALLEEIVEPSDARDVDEHAVDGRALIDRHPRLRDCAVAGDVARRSAEHVQNPHAALERLAARGDELARRPLKPCRAHPAVVVPLGREAIPIAGVAPQHPVVDDGADGESFGIEIVARCFCRAHAGIVAQVPAPFGV